MKTEMKFYDEKLMENSDIKFFDNAIDKIKRPFSESMTDETKLDIARMTRLFSAIIASNKQSIELSHQISFGETPEIREEARKDFSLNREVSRINKLELISMLVDF